MIGLKLCLCVRKLRAVLALCQLLVWGLVVVEAVVNLRYFVGLKTRGTRSNMGIYA